MVCKDGHNWNTPQISIKLALRGNKVKWICEECEMELTTKLPVALSWNKDFLKELCGQSKGDSLKNLLLKEWIK